MKRTTSRFPRATTPAVPRPSGLNVLGADDRPRVAGRRRVTPGASVRSIARANALARTGAPSLKRKPLRSVNVHVLPSRDTRGYAAATSGTSRYPSGGGLSG